MGSIPPEQLAALAKEDRGPVTKGIVVAFTTLAVISVILRVFTRLRYLGRTLEWEDYTIIVSVVFCIPTCIFQVMQVHVGLGKHAVFVDFPREIEMVLKYLFWSVLCYNTSLMFTKTSILLQYSRIFPVREMRIPLRIIMAICIVWGIASVISTVFKCIPVHAYWKILEQPSAKCTNTKTGWVGAASFNIFTDLLVAFLPVRVVWNLRIALRQKIALLAILTIGWFVCVVSGLRLYFLIISFAYPKDNTYYAAPIAYWSSIEMNLAIVCASLPALKPLIVKIVPGFSSTRQPSRSHANGTGVSSKLRTGLGVRSTVRRVNDEYELDRTDRTTSYQTIYEEGGTCGKNIYISRHIEQHFEQSSRISDSESQKELVAESKSASQ